jgi:hypothetical protein
MRVEYTAKVSWASYSTRRTCCGVTGPGKGGEANCLGLAFMRTPEPTLASFLETLQSKEIGRQLYLKWREQLEGTAGS